MFSVVDQSVRQSKHTYIASASESITLDPVVVWTAATASGGCPVRSTFEDDRPFGLQQPRGSGGRWRFCGQRSGGLSTPSINLGGEYYNNASSIVVAAAAARWQQHLRLHHQIRAASRRSDRRIAALSCSN